MRLLVPIATALVASVLFAFCGSRLIRLLTNRTANRKADELIRANKARWCQELDGKLMDRPNPQKIARAGEIRWQQALRGQRLARKPQGMATRNRKIADRKTPLDGIVKDQSEQPWFSKSVN